MYFICTNLVAIVVKYSYYVATIVFAKPLALALLFLSLLYRSFLTILKRLKLDEDVRIISRPLWFLPFQIYQYFLEFFLVIQSNIPPYKNLSIYGQILQLFLASLLLVFEITNHLFTLPKCEPSTIYSLTNLWVLPSLELIFSKQKVICCKTVFSVRVVCYQLGTSFMELNQFLSIINFQSSLIIPNVLLSNLG